jgi:propionyl-CoA synthetase
MDHEEYLQRGYRRRILGGLGCRLGRGHSYIVYGPLFKGCTTILFEGKPVGTPDAGVFWRVISRPQGQTMFTAPTAFRAIKREDPNAELMKEYDLSNFKALFWPASASTPTPCTGLKTP